jgi:NADP-dependent 3-hydroxy acid dehydrogenase YdfG
MAKAATHYGSIKQIEPRDLGDIVASIMALPPHLNVDSLTLKPIAQATHGVLAQP